MYFKFKTLETSEGTCSGGGFGSFASRNHEGTAPADVAIPLTGSPGTRRVKGLRLFIWV